MYITRHSRPFPAFFARSFAGDFENQIEQLFGSAVFNADSRFPLDIYEDKDNTYVRVELPGVDRKDISVEIADGNLEISATRKIGAGDNAQTRSFKRTVYLPENTQADKVSAASENGILTITLPKQEVAKPQKFTVSVN